MTAYLPWLLLLLACPLMMFFMMRGMGGGRNMDGDMAHQNTDDRVPRPDHKHSATAQSETGPAQDRDRIAQLEREVADLRAAREHPPGSNPTSRR
jgi:hypothetical protein